MEVDNLLFVEEPLSSGHGPRSPETPWFAGGVSVQIRRAHDKLRVKQAN